MVLGVLLALVDLEGVEVEVDDGLARADLASVEAAYVVPDWWPLSAELYSLVLRVVC